MKEALFNNPICSVEYHLNGLESPKPLDVILDMIKEAKINIKDIFISDITDQYLQYIDNMDTRDYEYLSEFIVFAATLLEAKSSALLPRIDIYDDEELDLTPQDRLILQIENYKLYRDASEKLQNLEVLHRFYRESKFTEDDYRFIVNDFNLDKLITAFKNILEKVEYQDDINKAPKTISKERFTVSDRIKLIITLIRIEKEIKFYSLFDNDFSRLEVINTFLAVLEVLKRQIAIAKQDNEDKDITLFHNENMDDYKEPEEIEEMLIDVKEEN